MVGLLIEIRTEFMYYRHELDYTYPERSDGHMLKSTGINSYPVRLAIER
jgi:hypothetical protein